MIKNDLDKYLRVVAGIVLKLVCPENLSGGRRANYCEKKHT